MPHSSRGRAACVVDVPVRDLRPAAIDERHRLLRLLDELSDEEWLAPTAAPGWRVKDIALHLLDDDLTWLSAQRDGDVSGVVDMADRRAFPSLLAAKNQKWIEAAQPLSRRVVHDLLAWSGRQVDTWHAAADLMSDGRVSWASDDPVPYWFNLAQELTERWVHQQQMREAVSKVGDHLELLPEVVRTFVWALPQQLPAQPEPVELAIVIPEVGQWRLSWSGEAWAMTAPGSMTAAPAATAAVTISMPADAAWRSFTGVQLAAADVQASAEQPLVEAVLSVRAIII